MRLAPSGSSCRRGVADRVWPALLLVAVASARADEPRGLHRPDGRPRVFVHVMPWFEAPPTSAQWGWHWTMNHYRPGEEADGGRSIASHATPAIGPYDSSDPDVVEYQTLTMRLAGIDGMIVDWYGRADFRDWPALHRASEGLLAGAERAGLAFAVCYEDQTVTALVEAGRLPAERRVEHVADELRWLAEGWFRSAAYARVDGAPLLLSFGHSGLDDDEWSRALDRVGTPLVYLSEHRRRPAAAGAFDWPLPKEGLAATRAFVERSGDWPRALPVVFPRFHDIYAEAGVHESWGRIDDADGATFRESLAVALAAEREMVQVATWNDWGEGTQIEPSVEYGSRDLAVLQARRRRLDPSFPWEPADLVLGARLLAARRAGGDTATLDRAAAAIVADDPASARRLLGTGGDRASDAEERPDRL